jgi:ABC-type phosphate transport system auxiliary subunit
MTKTILAARQSAAQERLLKAASDLAERFETLTEKVEVLKTVQSKDVEVLGLMQREAVADILETLAKTTEPKSKTTKKG